jgi:hypothetical protein
MAIITQALWTASTGITVTGADATSVTAFADAVSEALIRRCYPIAIEPKTLTLFAFDAPPDNIAFTPIRPCRSITALYLRHGANGDSSTLESTDLLTAYTDFVLDVDDALTGWSRSGRLIRRASSCWGYELRRPLGKLAYAVDPNRKALFVSGTFGPTAVNAAVQEAAARAVTLLYERRKTGAPFTSESWNGRSQATSSEFTALSAVNSKDVTDLLMAAGVLPIHIG